MEGDPAAFDPFADSPVDLETLGDPPTVDVEKRSGSDADDEFRGPASDQLTAHCNERPEPGALVDSSLDQVDQDRAGDFELVDQTFIPSLALTFDDGRRVTLGERVIIGRAPGEGGAESVQFVCFDDETVSRRHVEVQMTRGAVHVRDLGSTNGTAIDDSGHLIPVGTDDLSPVKVGDVVRFGDRRFELSLDHLENGTLGGNP